MIDVAGAGADGTLYLDVLCRDLKMDGGWSKRKPRYLQREWQQHPMATTGRSPSAPRLVAEE
jgi:hypothetical protein